MYHSFVRRRIRNLFEHINQGDAQPLLDGLAPEFEHIFIGDHAMAGRRISREQTAEWYARLYRLLPKITFDPQRIDVAGGPWNTIAVVEWFESNEASDGVASTTAGVHVVTIKWGKVTRLLILSDTATVHDMLARTEVSSGGESQSPALDEAPGWPAPVGETSRSLG